LEVFRLDGGHWTVIGSHAADEIVHVEPFGQAELRLRRWWPA
jgi:hypothetical protein